MQYLRFDESYAMSLQTNKIKDYRTRLLLKWLYEFKCVDYDIAFKVTGQKPNGGYRFIRRLIADGFLKQFHNVYMGDRVNLLTLTAMGVNYLKAYGMIDEDAPNIHFKRLERNASTLHNLLLQRAVYEQIEGMGNVYLDAHDIFIDWEQKSGKIRPDAIVTFRPNDKREYYEVLTGNALKTKHVAIEFERTSKSNKRIYYLLQQHDRNIEHKLYDEVLYYFDDVATKNLYEQKFSGDDDWTSYKVNDKGKMFKTLPSYTPKHRQAFKFVQLMD